MADAERTERFQQLEEQVNQRVREAMAGLQGELRDRLRRAGDQILEQLERELEGGGPELPGSFLAEQELDRLTDAATREGRQTAMSELASALSSVDHAGTQSAILSALVQEAGRFAGRSVLFLARPGGLELWSAHGWETSLEGTVVDYADDGPWSRDSLGCGVSGLGSGESGRLCSQVDAPLPTAAVLIPVVIRDRLGAVLYADRGEGEELSVEALQILAYAAALALETLPFRERSSTPTLAVPATRADGEPLGIWDAAAEARPEADPEPEAEPLPESAAFGTDAEAGDSPPPPPAEEDSGFELEVEEDAFAADESSIDVAEGGWELEDAEGGPAAEVGELQISEPEPPVDSDTGAEELDAEELDVDLEQDLDFDQDLGADLDLEAVEPAPAFEDEGPAFDGDTEPDAEPGGGVTEAESDLPAEGFDLSPIHEADPVEPAPEPPPPPAPSDPEEAVAEPGSPPEPSPSPAPNAGGSQVVAPSDLEGPGRAFSGAAAVTTGEGGAQHEEARRLARLLVSEIRLYNEEEVEEGRRNHDIYQRLKEDIDRSRQMYEERVDPDIREETDYFYQELVRNLGGGNAEALGI